VSVIAIDPKECANDPQTGYDEIAQKCVVCSTLSSQSACEGSNMDGCFWSSLYDTCKAYTDEQPEEEENCKKKLAYGWNSRKSNENERCRRCKDITMKDATGKVVVDDANCNSYSFCSYDEDKQECFSNKCQGESYKPGSDTECPTGGAVYKYKCISNRWTETGDVCPEEPEEEEEDPEPEPEEEPEEPEVKLTVGTYDSCQVDADCGVGRRCVTSTGGDKICIECQTDADCLNCFQCTSGQCLLKKGSHKNTECEGVVAVFYRPYDTDGVDLTKMGLKEGQRYDPKYFESLSSIYERIDFKPTKVRVGTVTAYKHDPKKPFRLAPGVNAQALLTTQKCQGYGICYYGRKGSEGNLGKVTEYSSVPNEKNFEDEIKREKASVNCPILNTLTVYIRRQIWRGGTHYEIGPSAVATNPSPMNSMFLVCVPYPDMEASPNCFPGVSESEEGTSMLKRFLKAVRGLLSKDLGQIQPKAGCNLKANWARTSENSIMRNYKKEDGKEFNLASQLWIKEVLSQLYKEGLQPVEEKPAEVPSGVVCTDMDPDVIYAHKILRMYLNGNVKDGMLVYDAAQTLEKYMRK